MDFMSYDPDDAHAEGVAQTEAILSALREGSRWAATDPGRVARTYMDVLVHYMKEARNRARHTGDDPDAAAREEAFAVFARSLYVCGVLVQHVANAEGLGLDEVFDVVRAEYDI